jgi:HSP20 family protein
MIRVHPYDHDLPSMGADGFDRDADGLFDSILGFGQAPLDWAGWPPGLEVTDNDDEVVLQADLPGMKKEDIDLKVAGGRLTISGQRRGGSFSRGIPLPHGIDAAKAKTIKID